MVSSPLSTLVTTSSEPIDMSFAQAFDQLNESTASDVLSPTLTSFLRSKLTQLQQLQNPFSHSTLGKGKGKEPESRLTSDGQESVVEIAGRFDVDTVEATKLLRVIGKNDKLEDEDWDTLTAYVFEERTCIIAIVGMLLRCSEDTEHPCYELAAELLAQIITQEFTSSLLSSFATRTNQPLPETVRASPRHSTFWVKQLLREQKALLEIVFLVYYTRLPPDGAGYKLLIDTIRETGWGQRQENSGFFDDEARVIVRELGDLLTIIAIEGLSLELTMGQEYLIPEPSAPQLPPADLYHPSNLKAINEAIESLVNSDTVRSSPILIAWAFILSRITNSLVDRGVPEIYHSFATQSLRIQASMSSNTNRSSSSSAQPLFQLYTSHALAPSSSLFNSLLSTLSSPLFGSTTVTSSDPNVLGYLLVLRSVIVSLPLIFRLSFLTTEQYSSLLLIFEKLYGNASAAPFCARFWERHGLDMGYERGAEAEGEDSIIDLARSRFPVQFGGFVRVVKALSHGVTGLLADGVVEEEGLAKRCADCTFSYLDSLTSFTHAMAPSPPLVPLPYEIVADSDPVYITYRASRPIPVSKSMIIPLGTVGRLVSSRNSKPVIIAWEIDWSAWKVFGDVLEDFAGYKKGPVAKVDVFSTAEVTTSLPIRWENDEEKMEDIANVLDLFQIVISNDPALGVRLADLVAPIDSSSSIHFLEILFRILERSLSNQQSVHSRLVTALLGLISSLLPSFPGAIWTFLRSSTLLFPTVSSAMTWRPDSTRQAVLTMEKYNGTYPITQAILSLVHALVLEEQLLAGAVPPEFAEIKQDVLVRAISWMRDDVWSSHLTWRFVELSEKFEMGRKMSELVLLVLSESELSAGAEAGKFTSSINLIVESFITKSTVALVSPLLSSIAAEPETIIALRRAGRHTDAQSAEDLVDSSMQLLQKLIQLRRRISGSTTSHLERLLLSHNASSNNMSKSIRNDSPLVESLTKFITSSLNTNLSIQATKMLTLLCIGSNELEAKSSSLVSLLGGSEKSGRLVTKLLSVVSDPQAEVNLQVALWDLISSIVESQPSFAMVLITGRQYPFDSNDATSQVVNPPASTVLTLNNSTTSLPFLKPLDRTAIGVGLETVGIWEESWERTPALLSAVLRFFDYTWQHLIDYGTALDHFRTLVAPWEAMVKIAFEDVGDAPESEAEVVGYCHRMMAKVHAVRILALDIQASTSRPVSKALEGRVAAKALFKALSNGPDLTKALSGATFSSFSPALHDEVYDSLQETISDFNLDSLRRPLQSHPLDDTRHFGNNYLYSIPLLRRTLYHLVSHSSSTIDSESLAQLIVKTSQLNLNFSLLDAQISNSRSWRQLLEIALPLLRRDATATATILSVASSVAADTANETRAGQIMITVHAERLSILLTMVEVIHSVDLASAKGEIIKLLVYLATIFDTETLPPLDSLNRRHRPQFHRTLFRIAFFVYRKLNTYTSATAFDADQLIAISSSTNRILRTMIVATRDLFTLARATRDVQIGEDLTLAVAVISQILHSISVPAVSIWLSYCQTSDLFRSAFEVFVRMDALDGRPLYAQQVLDLCLAMASSHPAAAEQMALAGVMTAMTNNALAAMAEAGAIRVTEAHGGRTPQHEIWTSMLALVVALVAALGSSTQFIDSEVTGFVRLYSAQIGTSMSWNAESILTLPALEEMSNASSLMYGIVARTSSVASSSVAVSAFVDRALYLLQQVVYAILHPNHLSTLLEPVTLEEKQWIDADVTTSEVKDLEKRPVVGSVTFALLQLARNLVDSLLAHSNAFATLTKDPLEWKSERAVVIPSATVTSNEKTSIGTLFDLSTFCIDLLRQPTSSLTLSTTVVASTLSSPLPAYSSMQAALLSQHLLEAVLLLISTQLALWLRRPDRNSSVAIRREITGELAGDLLSVLDKATNLSKTVVSGGGAGRGGKSLLGLPSSPTKSVGGVGVSSELMGVLKAFALRTLVE